MSMKEHGYSDGKIASSKQQSPQLANKDLDILAQRQSRPATLSERARLDPGSIAAHGVLPLHRTIGNRAVGLLLAGTANAPDTRRQSAQLKDESNNENRTGLPRNLRAGIESLSGMAMDDVRVHYNSSRPAEVQALAHTQGSNIYVGPGQEKHLPHEAWHVAQQKQGRVKPMGVRLNDVEINDDTSLESEADRMAARASDQPLASRHQSLRSNGQLGDQSNQPVQRQVRVGGGARRVNEAEYQSKGSKGSIGSKRSVAALIADGVRRVFSGVTELEEYANGKTDYIGDVKPSAAGTSWYRLPKDKLTVLGETHHNDKGNVEDVILGLGTSRFMYEPFNELVNVPGLNIPFAGTQSRLTQVNSGIAVSGLVDRKKFNPDLENIVIKALTGAAITRNEFIPGNPSTMNASDQKDWGKRASTSKYSIGERVALYLSIGIHLASDVAKNNFGPVNMVESPFVASGRDLKDYYLKNQAVLDQFMQAKDRDDLIGIYELTQPGNFKNLGVIKGFTLVLHEYGSRYIEQLGAQSKNKALEAEGKTLSGNLGAKIDDLGPAREEIMWEKIQKAKGYLIVGMGDAHRVSLQGKLNKAGIPHEEVEASLKRQSKEVDSKWKP